MERQHHRLRGHEFEQTPGDGGGQGSLVCCSPWGRKELDTTWQLNNNNKIKPGKSSTFESLVTLPTFFINSIWQFQLAPGNNLYHLFIYFAKTLIYLLNYSPIVYWIALSRMYAAFLLHKIKPELLRPRLYMSDLGPSQSLLYCLLSGTIRKKAIVGILGC